MKNLHLIITSALLFLYACEGNAKTTATLYQQTETAIIAVNDAPKQTIKVALLLDTSNSMDGLIHQAKAQLWEIINELSYAKCDGNKPNLEIALYEYGNDNLPATEGHIRQVLAFSDDLDEISEKLFSLTTRGGNEFCGQVIQTSLSQLEWGTNTKDLKLVFIAGNEPFTQGKVNYKDAIADAVEKDIVINTIFCGAYNQGIGGMWKDGAMIGKGDYMSINHTKEIVHVVTPYDQKIMEYNQKLNKTYVAYGSSGSYKMKQQATQDANANSVNAEIAVERAVAKSSGFYKNSSWDLIDGIKHGTVKVEDLKQSDLPAALRGKSKAEILNYLKEKEAQRTAIRNKIQELQTSRKKYIATQQKNNHSTDLESAMIKAIKSQAARKNYKW